MFPEYQTKSTKFRFDKYTTVKKLYEEAYKQKIEENFTKEYQEEFQKYIFVFRIHYDHQEWNLHKTYGELYSFQHSLSKKYKGIPRFPLDKDQEKHLTPQLMTPLVTFLDILIKAIYQTALSDSIVTNFLNFFPQNLGHGIIYGEYPMYKRSGGRYNQTSCMKECYHYMFPCVRSWKLRYFTVTDNGILYTSKSKSFEIKDMLLYCFKFTIYYGLFKTGRALGLVVESSTRRLRIQSPSLYNLILLIVAIKNALNDSPFAEQKKVKFQKYGSFAPIRHKCSSKFYADGKQYFQDLYEELKKAKKYVYITGWMITPYFMLKRPNPLKNKDFRLDGVLEQLAKKGVKIYIIVYQQPKIAVNNDSQFVQKYLQSLGDSNIKVMRHPNYLVIPFLWSHHQKIVLIDQRVAFFGGLDLCYGRWDTHKHQLCNQNSRPLWQGADFCNFRTRDIYKPRDYLISNLSINQPKMPWHDIAIQIRGGSVQDIARHFTNYWNFVNFQTKIDNDRELLSLAGIKHTQVQTSKFATARQFFKKFKFRRNTGKVEPMAVEMPSPTTSLTPNQINRQSILSGRSSRQKEQIQDQFYQNFIKTEQQKQNFFTDKLLKFPIKIFEKLKEPDPQQQTLLVANEDWKQIGTHQHLILRSASTWSGGLSEVESSIHAAYLDLIKNSKRFIYIENQFFIARQNKVIDELAKRILKAYKNKEKFKVMIFIPLLPGFQGDVRQSNSAVMRIQLHLEYDTIWRSTSSLFSKLQNGKMKYQEISNYVNFFSLRQHGLMADIPVTQILYIHSKLMIVDDEKMIIGSANINDRSLLGDRDSQIAILVQDDKTNINYKKDNPDNLRYSKQIRDFRCSLIQEHFHVQLSMAQDFYTDDNWSWFKTIAKRNTQIYRYVFGCYPDDKMKYFKDIQIIQVTSPLEKIKRYAQEKCHIKGHAVELPLYFLQKQNLEIHITQKEIILPDFFFT